MADVVIRTNNLGKTFSSKISSDIRALNNLSLEITQGEVFGFLGPNGAGKSTTIKILVNLIYATSGEAWILGKPCGDAETRKHIGYLPELLNLFDFLTFEEMLEFGGKCQGMNKSEIRSKVDELARLLDMERAKKMRIRKFSKGMQQRAGLAYALMGDPDVLILDEPMSGLDPIGRKDFVELIKNLRASGKTIFFSSHVLSDIENLCDRVGILVKGELRKVGNVADMLRDSSEGFSIRVASLDEPGRESLLQVGATIADQGTSLLIKLPKNILPEAIAILNARMAPVIDIESKRKSLEDIFMDVVKQRDLSRTN